MNCAKCGLHLPDGAVHCPSCAALVPRTGFFRKLAQALGLGGPGSRPGPLTRTRVIETRTERYQVKDARTGEMHTYTSLDAMPPEIRAQIEEARHAAERGAPTRITIKDASGVTKTYDSVDQMPPEDRALYERATKPKG